MKMMLLIGAGMAAGLAVCLIYFVRTFGRNNW